MLQSIGEVDQGGREGVFLCQTNQTIIDQGKCPQMRILNTPISHILSHSIAYCSGIAIHCRAHLAKGLELLNRVGNWHFQIQT